MDVVFASMGAVLISLLGPAILIGSKHLWQDRGGWIGRIFTFLNPLIASFFLGAIPGNAGLTKYSREVQDALDLTAQITVVFALPLLLYSCDLSLLKKLGGKCFLAFVLGAVSVLMGASLCNFMFRGEMGRQDAADTAGLMVSVFTGGAPNMAAAQVALQVDSDLFVTIMTTQLFFSAIYILWVITVAKPCLAKIFPPFKDESEDEAPGAEQPNKCTKDSKECDDDDDVHASFAEVNDSTSPRTEPEECTDTPHCGQTFPSQHSTSEPVANERDVETEAGEKHVEIWMENDKFSLKTVAETPTELHAKERSKADECMNDTAIQQHKAANSISLYLELCKKDNFKSMACSLGLTLALAGVSVALGSLVPLEGISSIVTILAVTTGALFMSRIRRIRELECSFALGQYVILVFCVTVGQQVHIETVISNAPIVAGFVGATISISLILHLLLAKLFSVDVDTLIVMSSSCIIAPAVVPMVTTTIKNDRLLMPGIVVGILGYAIGTYLGIGTSLVWNSA